MEHTGRSEDNFWEQVLSLPSNRGRVSVLSLNAAYFKAAGPGAPGKLCCLRFAIGVLGITGAHLHIWPSVWVTRLKLKPSGFQSKNFYLLSHLLGPSYPLSKPVK